MISQRRPYYWRKIEDTETFSIIVDKAMAQMKPPAMSFEDYERRNQVHEERAKYAKAHGDKPLIQLFATCPECLGRCCIENPDQEYDYDHDTGSYDPRKPEEVDCPTCDGTGWVEIEPEPEPKPDEPPEIAF